MITQTRSTRAIALGLLLSAAAVSTLCPAPAQQTAAPPILDYIARTWDTLTRSNRTLPIAAVDPKLHPDADGRWPVYIASTENRSRVELELRRTISADGLKTIDLRYLPRNSEQLAARPGLLYLPYPYVVPGGRFNEMYGWDSYFIQLGLLRDGRVDLAKSMADDFLYEIRNYGRILNANRTYYLTRSQPPFLTQMLLGVYGRTKDRAWLRNALPAIETFYRYWTREPHLTSSGLSRYYDLGDGPAPESVAAERDASGKTHYDLVRQYYRTHKVPDYDVREYYDAKRDELTPLFYKGDRSMRESGFDPSNRFGPFSVDIIHYNPVCLNSLLYLMETQTAEILRDVDKPLDAAIWDRRAKNRAALINRLLWNEGDGLYYDCDFVHHRQRRYAFLTTFYPLWAGIATAEQAARVVKNLPMFERAGGLQTSTAVTGSQWDAPYGWAPLELIAIQALRRYHYDADAERLSEKFLSLVAEQYRRQGVIVEKYDVVRRSTETSAGIQFGYHTNEAGFGWTNGVFVTLLDAMSAEHQQKLLAQ